MRRLLLTLALAAAVGCTSPEATRTRGGGPGGDTHNRPEFVKMHEGSRQYWDTPVEIKVQHPPLDAAAHARQTAVR